MPNSPKTEILALLRAHDEAIARGDAASVIAPMSPDIVSYDLPPPLEYRGDEVRNVAGLEKWFATWDGPVTTEFSDPAVLIDGDLAVAFGHSRMRGRAERRNSDEAANSGGLDPATIHQLSWNALNDEATEFS
jgi:ketosteroid isomerase-like protein